MVDKAAWDETVIDTPAKPAVEEVSHVDTVVDKAAWDETVIDTPAKPAVEEVSHVDTVVDKAAWDETVTDKPAWVENVVNATGTRSSTRTGGSGTRAPRPGTPERAAKAGRVRPTRTRPTWSPTPR